MIPKMKLKDQTVPCVNFIMPLFRSLLPSDAITTAEAEAVDDLTDE